MIGGHKIGFYANGSLRDMPLEETCRILKDIGYDALELDGSWLRGAATPEELARQCGVIRQSGLELSEIILQEDYVNLDPEIRKTAQERTLAGLRSCSEAGISVVNLFTGPRPWLPRALQLGKDLSVKEAWDMVLEAFDILVPQAEALGVKMAVENVWGMLAHDFFTLNFLVNHYNSPNLGVNFDPSHDCLAGNRDMEFLLTMWGKERIHHIHLKDAAGSQVKGNVLFPPLGEGFVDWQGFRKGLDAIGYDGVLSVEYEAGQQLDMVFGGDWAEAARDCYRRLNILFKD